MSSQVNFSLESFLTQTASKRLVASVFSHVSYQVAALRERFSTDNAFVWLLTCMNVCVLLHVRFLMESFTTIVARVRPGVTVDEKMRGQSAATFESFPALWTLEDPLRSVCGRRVKTIVAPGHVWPKLAGDVPAPPTPHLHHHLRAGDVVVVGGAGELVLLLAGDGW